MIVTVAPVEYDGDTIDAKTCRSAFFLYNHYTASTGATADYILSPNPVFINVKKFYGCLTLSMRVILTPVGNCGPVVGSWALGLPILQGVVAIVSANRLGVDNGSASDSDKV
jgi:hypothetical protein